MTELMTSCIDWLKDNIEIVCIIAIVISFQIWSIISTYKKISSLKNLFLGTENITTKKVAVNSLKTTDKDILLDIKTYKDDGSDILSEHISAIVLTKNASKDLKISNDFAYTIDAINVYMYKNAGTSADFNELKNICESKVDAVEADIQNNINTPLYLGLAGTFIGIITGLFGLDINQDVSNSGIDSLLDGVVIAMTSSFFGLILTLISSSILYRNAQRSQNVAKEVFYGFMRRELMPTLSNSMSASLDALKNVLGHFVDKFGRNLDTYTDSAALLNDNLEKQHQVLEEINKLSLTETATTIASTFNDLKSASESLNVFKEYQRSLNSTIANLSNTTSKIDTLVSKFDSFGSSLSVVVANQSIATQLQEQFKDSIETHFPLGSEGREMWRSEFDLLTQDALKVHGELSNLLANSSQYIKNFADNNSSFFDTFNKIESVLFALTQNTELQVKCYSELKNEIGDLKSDYNRSQEESLELNKTMLIAIKQMTEAFANIKTRKDNE